MVESTASGHARAGPDLRPVAARAWGVPWHIGSHRGLAASISAGVPSQVPQALDAVIVPASRPADNLRHAAGVALQAGCHLLVLCSGDADDGEARAAVCEVLDPEDVTVVAVPIGWTVPHLLLRADDLPWVREGHTDTGLKRNVGLLVARGLGWERVLFLDDDVRGLGQAQLRTVRRALAGSSRHPEAVGWAVDDYPDNSVVCHAYRAAGGDQGTFIGGGALAVKTSQWTPHFPRVYNEDWLFMLPLLLRSRAALAFAGTMRQEPYDPFSAPATAARQEFGDVLAEGLFRLLHTRLPFSQATTEGYWRNELALRLRLIHTVRSRLETRRPDVVADRMCAVLDQAIESNRTIGDRPLQLAEWVSAWLGDRRSWTRRLAAVPPRDRVEDVLADLGLVPGREQEPPVVVPAPPRPARLRRPSATGDGGPSDVRSSLEHE